ncbi:hypothetical protein, partial [Desulfoluna sp.]|uniref:hypothetical protein n=1 Tax=Desulfoluna sp. TaxID=2045199 RepID=UPI002625C9B1
MHRLIQRSLNKYLSLFVFFLIVFLMAGCHSGSNDDPPVESPPVALEDPDGVLASVGLTTDKEVKDKLTKSGLIALSVEIRNANPALPTEKIVSILKENNKTIEYKKLEKQGVPAGVVSRLKKLPYSPVATKEFVALPDPEMFPITASEEALALLNREKLKKLNRKLQLRGQAPLTMDEFLVLQTGIGKVEFVNNFGNLDQRTQNIPARDMTLTKAGGSDASPGYTLVNAVDELKANGGIGDAPSGVNPCGIAVLPPLPMPIAQLDTPIETLLVQADGADAVVSFPETGIAVIMASREVTLIDSEGRSLCTGNATDAQFYYLPITHANRCKPFRFVGANSAYTVTLIEMITPERLTDRAFVDGKEYLTNGTTAKLLNASPYFNPSSCTISTLDSH